MKHPRRGLGEDPQRAWSSMKNAPDAQAWGEQLTG